MRDLDGDLVIDRLQAALDRIPGIETEVMNLAQGPASGKPVHLRIRGDNWNDLLEATAIARDRFETTEGLVDVEDSRPLPGKSTGRSMSMSRPPVATARTWPGALGPSPRAGRGHGGRHGATRHPRTVARHHAGRDLQTRKSKSASGCPKTIGFSPPSTASRCARRTDWCRCRTSSPGNPWAKLGQINRVDQERYFDVKADVVAGVCRRSPTRTARRSGPPGPTRTRPKGPRALVYQSDLASFRSRDRSRRRQSAPRADQRQRTHRRTDGMAGDEPPLPAGLDWEWTGDQEEQAESGAFLMQAFAGGARSNVHHPAGAVQLVLQRVSRADGGGAVGHRLPHRHAGDGPALLRSS